jgi:hypothetical protein
MSAMTDPLAIAALLYRLEDVRMNNKKILQHSSSIRTQPPLPLSWYSVAPCPSFAEVACLPLCPTVFLF